MKNLLLENIIEDDVLGIVYIPPDKFRCFNEDIFYDFQTEVTNKCCKYKNIVLIGDFNGHTADKPDCVLVCIVRWFYCKPF